MNAELCGGALSGDANHYQSARASIGKTVTTQHITRLIRPLGEDPAGGDKKSIIQRMAKKPITVLNTYNAIGAPARNQAAHGARVPDAVNGARHVEQPTTILTRQRLEGNPQASAA